MPPSFSILSMVLSWARALMPDLKTMRYLATSMSRRVKQSEMSLSVYLIGSECASSYGLQLQIDAGLEHEPDKA